MIIIITAQGTYRYISNNVYPITRGVGVQSSESLERPIKIICYNIHYCATSPVSYRHPRYHNQKTLLEPYQAMALALFVLIPLPLILLSIARAINSPQTHTVETSIPLERAK